jgi:DNA-directed RNA polymerase subunit A'
LQDLRVEYDGTVRDATGKIIQFKYGEDGLDVSRTESGKIDVQRIIDGTE